MTDEQEQKPCPDCDSNHRRRVKNTLTGELHTVKCHCQYDDLQFKNVIQCDSKGCGIAAVAIVANKTYKEVRQYVHLDRDFAQEGMYDTELEGLLEVFGFSYQNHHKHLARLNTPREVWPPAPFADAHICRVRNLPNTAWHFVIMQKDGRVIDPWWGVIQGLHRYPEVMQVYGLWKIPVPVVEVLKEEKTDAD